MTTTGIKTNRLTASAASDFRSLRFDDSYNAWARWESGDGDFWIVRLVGSDEAPRVELAVSNPVWDGFTAVVELAEIPRTADFTRWALRLATGETVDLTEVAR